jgi:hypothetical protein
MSRDHVTYSHGIIGLCYNRAPPPREIHNSIYTLGDEAKQEGLAEEIPRGLGFEVRATACLIGARRDGASYRASRPPAVPVLTASEYAPAAVTVYLQMTVSVRERMRDKSLTLHGPARERGGRRWSRGGALQLTCAAKGKRNAGLFPPGGQQAATRRLRAAERRIDRVG